MRGLLVVLLVGCTVTAREPDESEPGPIIYPTPSPGECGGTTCSGGTVCARNGACLPPSQVRAVHVMWLVSGKTADATTCSPHPDLRIEIHPSGGGDRVSYAPVPCIAGKFSVDRLPTTFDRAELGPVRDSEGWRYGSLDANGEVTLDLPF